MNLSPRADLWLLSRDRPPRSFAEGDFIGDAPGSADEVLLLTAGTATLSAETPFGPHPAATLRAPTILNLKRAITGSTDLYRIVFGAGSQALAFTSDEARSFLFSPGKEGQAFRRTALSSVTAALRETNSAVARFFDELKDSARTAVRDSGDFKIATKAVPIDPARVNDLFDAAGLNPTGLPDLGLVARSLPSEAALMRAGTAGDEAYLLAEGRLRVSIRIPGVGEEALAILNPGEIVGEMTLVDDAPRSADVRAHDGPALVYVVSRVVFRKLLESGDPAGAPLLAGITIALIRRHEEAMRKAAAFRVLAGPF
jgi:hypothetical protein